MDSNPSRARAKARRKAEQQKALRTLVDAANRLDAAQLRLDAALVRAVNLHVSSRDLEELLGVSHATLWRRVKAAREAVSE